MTEEIIEITIESVNLDIALNQAIIEAEDKFDLNEYSAPVYEFISVKRTQKYNGYVYKFKVSF